VLDRLSVANTLLTTTELNKSAVKVWDTFFI
jgi:hypothetical protein